MTLQLLLLNIDPVDTSSPWAKFDLFAERTKVLLGAGCDNLDAPVGQVSDPSPDIECFSHAPGMVAVSDSLDTT